MSKKDMLGPLVRALVGLLPDQLGILFDVVNKLKGTNGVAVKTAIAKVLREAAGTASPADTTHLRFVEAVVLPATLGATTIAQSGDVFTGWLDPDLRDWGTDVPSADTAPVTALVYEMTKDGNFLSLFSSLGEGWYLRQTTQGQIVSFCTLHPEVLRQDGYGTLFPFQVGEETFVANVRLVTGRLLVFVFRLGYDHVWDTADRTRVVVLQ